MVLLIPNLPLVLVCPSRPGKNTGRVNKRGPIPQIQPGKRNRPFLRFLVPLFQIKGWCSTFHVGVIEFAS